MDDEYQCSRCGACGVRLWRQYNTFLDHIQLLCRPCGERDQRQPMAAPGDTIGWLVPAVPDGNGSFWGYTSVPLDRVKWWNSLPFYPP